MGDSHMTTPSLDPKELRAAFLELLTYLATSARGTVYEPKLYGPLRLMEAAQRVIELMNRLGLGDDELNAMADRVVAEAMAISTDDKHCSAFTDEASVTFARKLRDT
jgi:hypothetical protein